MRKAFISVVILILIAIMQLTLMTAQGYSGSQILLPLLTKPVTVDGKWTAADEWSDAVVITLINCNCSSVTANGYLYAKHDPSNFYFLIDFASSTVLDGQHDNMDVFLDPLHNGGTVPQSDDRVFVVGTSGGVMNVGAGVSQWSLNNPLPEGVKVVFSMAGSSNRAQPHEIVEFMVPFSMFSGMQSTIGFSVAAGHGSVGSSEFSLALWPANRQRDNPSTWGEVAMSSTPIPEFSSVWSVIAATLLVSVTLTWSRRRASPKG
jgi:hypothetical protein